MKKAILLLALTLCGCGKVEAEIIEPQPETEVQTYWMDGSYRPADRTLYTVDAEGRIDEWHDVDWILESPTTEDEIKVWALMITNGTKTIEDDMPSVMKAYGTVDSIYDREPAIIITDDNEFEIK